MGSGRGVDWSAGDTVATPTRALDWGTDSARGAAGAVLNARTTARLRPQLHRAHLPPPPTHSIREPQPPSGEFWLLSVDGSRGSPQGFMGSHVML